MSTLSEQELAAVLHGAVGEPVDAPGRAAVVRRRARRMRWRRIAMTSVVLVAVTVAMPAVLSLRPSASPRTADSGGTPTTMPSGSPQSGVCSTATGCPVSTIPSELRRRLALPVLRAGAACPVSASRRFPAGGGFSGSFEGVGEGPVYLTGGPIVSFDYPPTKDSGYAGSDWGGQKVIWAVDPNYSGPLLLRGAQIDGRKQLRFDHYLGAIGYAGDAGDGKPYVELAYPEGGPGLRTYPSAVRLQGPGCYVIQVDGIGFTSKIVFRARVTGK